MKEKVIKQAEDYANGKSSSYVFKEAHKIDFLAGYTKAIEDSKAPEMLEMLNKLIKAMPLGACIEEIQEAKQLIKQATEL